MNDRVSPSVIVAPQPLADECALVRADRTRTELLHGRAIALAAADPAAPLLLAAAVETLTEARLQALRRWGGAPRLLLTGERLQTLQPLPVAGARALVLPAPADDGLLPMLQRLAAVIPGHVDPAVLDGAQPATPAMEAALDLARRARLTPALWVCELPAGAREALQAAQLLCLDEADVRAAQAVPVPALRRVSDARVPIAAHDDCTLVLFREIDGAAEHVAVIFGPPPADPAQPVHVRLHSSCLTGDLLGSRRCDCGDQLHDAIEHLAREGGVLLYLAQEGRGIGLANKLRAYRLQDGGLDTLEADRHLGFRDDERDFGAAVAMLQLLHITRIRLLTNNPGKIESLRRGGIEVVDRVPLVAPVNAHNARYLQTKRERAGHLGHDEDDGTRSVAG